MNIPQKIYARVQGLPFAERAGFLAIITYYMEYGVIHDEGGGAAMELFREVRDELDDILHRRYVARKYRARKKAEKEAAKAKAVEQAEKTETSDISEKTGKSEKPEKSEKVIPKPPRMFYDTGRLTRRKRRRLEKKGFMIVQT